MYQWPYSNGYRRIRDLTSAISVSSPPLGIKLRKKRAVRHQAAEERVFRLLDAAPDDDDRPSWGCEQCLRQRLLQVLLVFLCCAVIAVDLMLRPQISRQLLAEPLRVINPIDLRQLGCKWYYREGRHERVERSHIHVAQTIELAQELFPLCREAPVVLSDLTKHQGEQEQRHALEHIQILRRQRPCPWRVIRKALRPQVAGLHQSTSTIGLPLANGVAKSIIAPNVGTRSRESIGLSTVLFGRTRGPMAIIQVVRERGSPVR